MGSVQTMKKVWAGYTARERRNIAMYIVGIMFYKLGLEAFNGSITTLAKARFGDPGGGYRVYTKMGILQGLNQAFQCIGSILIAPLIKRFPTRSVLAVAILFFGFLTALLMIIDASTGGRIKKPDEDKAVYGSWHPNILFPVYCATGIAYGMVELIRRVIPRDIVGGDINKLRRMDAIVHIFYEVAGTGGAIASTYLVIRFGENYAFLVTPIFFTIACVIWTFITTLEFQKDVSYEAGNYLVQLWHGASYFGVSIWRGAAIIFSERKFIWLPLGYSLALYGHRYLETGIAPIIAEEVFGKAAYYQILVSGSNLGELIGALAVFLLNDIVPTPIPWLRMDSLLLLIVWVFPYFTPTTDVKYVWALAAVFVPISFGWAAGDVSLAAYIQASLARREADTLHVSALGAVMAFLYCTYISLFAILSPTLGLWVDKSIETNGNAQKALLDITGIQFTVIAAILFAATLIPKGALSLNPKLLSDEDLSEEFTEDKFTDNEVNVELDAHPKTFELEERGNSSARF